MVIRGDDFSIDSAAVEELKENPKVTILYHTQVEKVEGDSAVRRVVLKDRKPERKRCIQRRTAISTASSSS